jgi:hypothetical protein
MYVNLTVKFSILGGLDPARLQFHLQAPQGPIRLLGTAEDLSFVNLTYSASSYPHWLINLPKMSASDFNVDVTNPDGAIVGGRFPCFSTAACPTNYGDPTIESGATITMTFPGNVNSTQGYILTAVYQNALGGRTNLILN